MKAIISSIPNNIREQITRIILISWGIYMVIIVPVNHFLFPAWYHGEMGIPFGDSFDIWAVWLIAAYSIGLGFACFVAALDPLRYYTTVLEIFFGTLLMAIVVIAGIILLGTDPYLWTTWFTALILIVFCTVILLVYPLTPVRYSKDN